MAGGDPKQAYDETLAWAAGVRAGMALSTAILAVLVERKVISSADAQAAVLVAKEQALGQRSLTPVQREAVLATLEQCRQELRH